MEKVLYVVEVASPPDPTVGDQVRSRLLDDLGPRLLGTGAVRALSFAVHDTDAAAAPSPAPSADGVLVPLAVVSAWVDNYQRRESLDDAAASLGLASSTYLVAESLVEDYGTTPHGARRDWPDGERSPGVLTVAALNRPADMDEATWLHNWHEVQSPRSLELQPRCRYVRNRVVQRLSPGATDVDGIVEEAWASPAVVADPMQFFLTGGDPDRLGPMVTEMLANVEGALDLARLRSTTMSEYLLRTL